MKTPRFPQRLFSDGLRAADRSEPAPRAQGPSLGERSSTPALSNAEVILSCDGSASQPACEQARPPIMPCGVFLPENYEPNYAYPLIVWLHDTGRSEHDIARVLPQVSVRNYVGLALRGTAALEGGPGVGYGWRRSHRARVRFEDELQASVHSLRRGVHVNGERIFLVGAGDGGTLAWEIFLSRPEWFAGLAVLGGRFPSGRRPLRRFRALRDKSLFLAASQKDPAELLARDRTGRLMHSAGLSVTFGGHLPGRPGGPAVLRRLDDWIMESIGGCR